MKRSDADSYYNSATPPAGAIFVAADEPLLVYPSIAAAEAHLEAIDVKSGVYSAVFGPRGEPFSISAEEGFVVIEPISAPSMPSQLKALLLRYLDETGNPTDATESLADLVDKVWRAESDFWPSHDPYGDRFGTALPRSGCLAEVALLAVGLYFAVS